MEDYMIPQKTIPYYFFCFCIVLFSQAAIAANLPQVMLILDGSGSMWGDAGGQSKIEAAREVMAKVVPSLPSEVNVGLTVYGHRKKGDCNDIEILVPIGSANREEILSKINSIKPKGKTPIAATLKKVVDTIKETENETTIILVSDGVETCRDDPCSVVRSMKSLGINFILHVVGFAVTDKAKKELTCLAKAGGGQYYGASDADALLAVLENIKTEVIQKVEKAKTITTKARSRLGKLRIKFKENSLVSIATIKIVRKSDGKVVKTVSPPEADSLHPLPAGEYELILGFANVNFRDPSDAPLGSYAVKGGETTAIELGSVGFNIAQPFMENSAVWAVSLIRKETNKSFVTIYAFDGNDYYLFKPKPVPEGAYDLAIHFYESPQAAIVAKDIKVEKGKETTVTLDSGMSLKEPKEQQGVTGWDLVAVDSKEPILKVRRRFDNEYPLWENFIVPPGSYDLYLYIQGMDEPLLAGEGIEISQGQLVKFDTGL
jgi:hypothetical protein